jgi:hypothetical protein
MPLKPPKYVKTVKDLIYWLYAELIAKAAGFENNYGFVISRFNKLKSGEMEWSSTIRDHQKEWEKGKICAYCGSTIGLTIDHVIPKSRGVIDPRINNLLDSPDNCVWACKKCNCSKGDKDIFEWYGKENLDEVPKLVTSKFLKLSYKLHETQGSLNLEDPNLDGVLDIYDLGVVITHLFAKLSKEKKGGKAPS